jgi:hypothetical protein
MSADLDSWSDARNFDMPPDSVDGIHIRMSKGEQSSPGEVQVRTSTTYVTLSQARQRLAEVLIKKNLRSREYVVICAGAADKDGLVMPLDIVIFELLQELGVGELPPTPNIGTAWLHLSETTELVRCI